MQRFLPASYERRGVFLSFDRKILRFARLRVDNPEDMGQWQVVLPYHASARRGAVAIIPWQQLTQFTDMSPRDEAMVKTISRIKVSKSMSDPAIDPLVLRSVLLHVDAELGATADRCQMAKREKAMDSLIRNTVEVHLFANLVQEFAKDVSDEVLTNMTGGLYRQLSAVSRSDPGLKVMLERFSAKVVLHAAERLGLAADHVTRRMDDLADMIVHLGKVDVQDIAAAEAAGLKTEDRVQDGYLIRAREELRWLHGEMDASLVHAREELRYPLEMVLFSIEQFLEAAATPIEAVERDVSNIGRCLQRYDTVRPRIAKARMGAAWALDGWSAMVRAWREALDKVMKNELTTDGKMHIADVVELERAITTIFQNMPSMPQSELEAMRTRLDAWNHFESTRAKVVQSGCDWSSSRPDEELRQRIAKARPG